VRVLPSTPLQAHLTCRLILEEGGGLNGHALVPVKYRPPTVAVPTIAHHYLQFVKNERRRCDLCRECRRADRRAARVRRRRAGRQLWWRQGVKPLSRSGGAGGRRGRRVRRAYARRSTRAARGHAGISPLLPFVNGDIPLCLLQVGS